MLFPIERLCLVALRAKGIAYGLQPSGVWIVAVRAADTLRSHPALQKRSDFEDLFANLPIDKIQTILRKLRPPGFHHRLEHPFTRHGFTKTSTARVTRTTLIDLGFLGF
jgi:hypothetical protein